ncbi:hypothetical protein SDC9_177536 [bioreactor metagenome]|uniref:Uncharacterized protein n=1 Tax=bioreactor metagenome TaxID=1076179 RepID=A0A645GWD4_9ZZZZ
MQRFQDRHGQCCALHGVRARAEFVNEHQTAVSGDADDVDDVFHVPGESG